MDRLAVVRRRLHRQGLTGEHFETPQQVVHWLGAMQAQEFAEALWSIGQRLGGATEAEVERAFADGEILRTHVLRPTWHFVAAADIRWLLRLTAPRVHAANRYMYKQSGLDEAVLARSHEQLARALEGGEPLTRTELAERLREAGIVAEKFGLAYILMHAELEGLVCSGPRRGKQQTYQLLEQRVPQTKELSADDALAELTLRYFRSHGPATVKDLAWWSSLTVADVKRGLGLVGSELSHELGEDGKAWYYAPGASGTAAETGALLLGSYDESHIAHKDLKIVLAEEPPRKGLLTRPIVIDGRTVGSWKRSLTSREAVLEATLFTRLNSSQEEALRAETERYGRFVGLPVRLERASPITASHQGT